MKLPQISYDVGKAQSEIVAMRGINYSDQLQVGDLRDSLNISARRYPYITTRRARAKQEGSSCNGLTAWESCSGRGYQPAFDVRSEPR